MLSVLRTVWVGLPKRCSFTLETRGISSNLFNYRTGAEIKAPSMHLGISLCSPALSDALSTVVPFMRRAMRTSLFTKHSRYGRHSKAVPRTSGCYCCLRAGEEYRKRLGRSDSNSKATLPLHSGESQGQIHKQCVVFSDGEVMHHHSYR